jgi:hypothetical protein
LALCQASGEIDVGRKLRDQTGGEHVLEVKKRRTATLSLLQ